MYLSQPTRSGIHNGSERAFQFLQINERPPKPRHRGLTEIRGPYYTPFGPRYLQDVLETMGVYIDMLKFAGGSFALMPRDALKRVIEICHQHEVLVSAGGFIEHVLGGGPGAVDAYLREAKTLEFDIVEISTESVRVWRTDVAARIASALGLDHVMFEAADPKVFSWYIKRYGPDVNLFIDHSQIVQLECLRS